MVIVNKNEKKNEIANKHESAKSTVIIVANRYELFFFFLKVEKNIT